MIILIKKYTKKEGPGHPINKINQKNKIETNLLTGTKIERHTSEIPACWIWSIFPKNMSDQFPRPYEVPLLSGTERLPRE